LEKYMVLTFDGYTFAVDQKNLSEWAPPSAEDGGFDLVDQMDEEQFHGGLYHCLATKGYCVVQTFDTDQIRQQASKEVEWLRQSYKRLPLEEAEIILGKDNKTKALDLDAEELEKEAVHTLVAMDSKLHNFMASNIAPITAPLGLETVDMTSAMIRMHMSEQEAAALEAKPMTETAHLEDFLTWLNRRHLCVIYCVEVESGNLLFEPVGEETGLSPSAIPLASNRYIIFRNDCLTYSYQPIGQSLAMQAWLLAETRRFEVRSLTRPPRLDNAELHVMSCMERFPVGCYGADKVWAMFQGGTDAHIEWPESR
jgi:polyketide synthase-associated protein